jgi:alanyl-tRNA synthetase
VNALLILGGLTAAESSRNASTAKIERFMLTGSQIRQKFIDYFVQHGHKHVHSSSLVPANDPTLLFTNAGMNQFKDVFLGLEKRAYSRATTSQKCVRAGGKHNDLENVGFTKRHHTFFEMLGNFSFGDYFKQDAIKFAWELVTSPEWFGIAKDKLYCTIFEGVGPPNAEFLIPRDREAEDAWLKAGVPAGRIYPMGMKDNFWAMGETGPCGPCSEIHYDMGPAASDLGHGVTAPECHFPCDCGRYVEIWNLVFMQFDRDAGGTLNPLPKPCVDTGMGLERTTSVLQGVLSNYDTDLFTPLIKRAAELTGTDLKKELQQEEHARSAASLRVIADHARATTFLISDGVVPANEGRGYVLRKIMRRAIMHGRLLRQTKPFLHEMVFAVRDLMMDAYPELKETADQISRAVLAEETRFANTLEIGLDKLESDFAEARGRKVEGIRDFLAQKLGGGIARFEQHIEALLAERRLANDLAMLTTQVSQVWGYELAPVIIEELQQKLRQNPKLLGDEAFHLFETYGVPLDFMLDVARDQGVEVDLPGFEEAREAERVRARASWKGGSKATASPAFRDVKRTEFVGYHQTEASGCEVLAIVNNGQGVKELRKGESGEIVLDHTPFYAESGGQVGDVGWFYDTGRNAVLADVTGCYAPVQGVRAHKVIARQNIVVGDKVDAVVNADVRTETMRNHTGTHLLHAALREVLGKHVKQAGSLVDPAHLRFDFSHFTAVEDEQLQDIEDIVNKEVLRNVKVQTIEDVPIDEAINQYHAMALFGEKYGDRVRVIKIGDFSTELCGGTHTAATGEIGLVKILHEGSVSSGVRRIEAVTGEGSLRHFRTDHQLEGVARSIIRPDQHEGSLATALRYEIESRDEEVKRLKKELEQARMKSAASAVSSIEDKVRVINGVKVLAHRADNLERGQMRTLVDNLRNKLGSGVVVLGSSSDGRVALIVGVTKDLTSRLQAGKIIGPVAQKVGGSGGGRPDMAEAGGKDPAALDAALAEAYKVVESLLGD